MVLTAVILILVPADSAVKISQSADILLGTAIHQEEVEGDLEAAIETYKKLLAEYPDNHPLAAQAQFRIGICYEKLGLKEAEKAFQKVIENYPDQTAIVEMARKKLAVLSGARASVQKGEGDLGFQKVWSGTGVDELGDVSPDGRLFGFTSWDTGDLAVLEFATGKIRRLTDKGPWTKSSDFAMFPEWSPDGRFLAYDWFDGQGKHMELRLIGLEEPEPTILYPHKLATAGDILPMDWHPNGEEILVLIGRPPDTYQLGFISVSDKTLRVLKEFKNFSFSIEGGSPWNFVISPDGRTIAYDKASRENPMNRDIFLLSTNGTQEQRLFDHPALDHVCAWTADGQHLLFVSDRTGSLGLWIVPVKEGKILEAPRLVKADMGSFSPIGRTGQDQLFFASLRGGSDIYLAEVDPAAGQLLAPAVKQVRLYEGRNAFPEFSPDGKSFLYLSTRGNYPWVTTVLCLSSLETGEIREIDTGIKTAGNMMAMASAPQWRPDGRAISIFGKDGQGRSGIHQFDLESGKTSLLVPSGEKERIRSHCWATDGLALFYTKGEQISYQIYTWDLKTGQEKVLPGSPEDAWNIDISFDGQWLAILNGERTRRLSIIPAKGGTPQELHSFKVNGMYNMFPTWSADGKFIYYCSRKTEMSGWDMWRFSVEDKQVQKIDPSTLNFRFASFHPDGRRMIFSTETFLDENSEIWMMENFLPKAATKK